jgi:nitroimidazol reductase NimA-like FMN-containing flavoprotein (pyridoxamine 5'-phosphate oxidase superfamily)
MTDANVAPYDADALPEEPGLTRLDRAECLAHLATGGRGRVALTVGALPVIVPVRYIMSDGSIVFPVSRDDVWRATDDHIVAFNADGVDRYQHLWSVGVLGRARHLTSDGERLVALTTDRINGHRET